MNNEPLVKLFYLKLCKDFSDMPEASLCYIHVLFIRLSVEQRLRGVVEKLSKGKQLLYLFHSSILYKKKIISK